MTRTELPQEVRQMRFKEVHKRLDRETSYQEEAARVLGVCVRTFRRLFVNTAKWVAKWVAAHFWLAQITEVRWKIALLRGNIFIDAKEGFLIS
ncbi:MAG: hypothetical protein HY266_08480 [Deltaproteobacteria bacterium]|nr:hypothetical protein [Deltaproteobacteria bacterium]